MYKIVTNRTKVYNCTCPTCDSNFLCTESEIKFEPNFICRDVTWENANYITCPCCGNHMGTQYAFVDDMNKECFDGFFEH